MSDPPYGKYVFAPQRKGKVPKEKNTPQEQNAYDNLKDHVRNNTPMDNDVAIELMQIIDDGLYSGVIHEPDTEFVFRGIKLGIDSLEEFLGIENVPDSGSKMTSQRVNARSDTDSGRTGSTAWTTSIAAAKKFTGSYRTREYSVILVARTDENPDSFMEGPGGFYKVKDLDTYAVDEVETIALGPIRLYKVYWQKTYGRTPDDQFDMPIEEMEGKSPNVSEALLRSLIRASIKSTVLR
jgi:hypothetical protein